MKFTNPQLLSAVVLLSSISVAAKNKKLMTFDKEQVISNFPYTFKSI